MVHIADCWQQEMKITLTLILAIYTLTSTSQVKDSTIYNYFKNMENIDSVVYRKEFHNNLTLKKEGWVVYENLTNEKNYRNIEVKDENVISLCHSFGVVKMYNSKGILTDSIFIPTKVEQECNQIKFNDDHTTNKIMIWKPKSEIPLRDIEVTYTTRKSHYTFNTEGNEYFISHHYKNGKIYRTKRHIGNWVKDGCWLWYDLDGNIKKEVFYSNGKK